MDELGACPVCKSDRLKHKFTGRTTRRPDDNSEWRMDQCEACGLAFLNPRPSWSDLRQYYDSTYSAYKPSHGATNNDDVVVAQALSSGTFRHIPLPKNKRVLDIGAGGGYFLRICEKLGAKAQGVEPNEIAATTAREQSLSIFHGTLDEFKTDERFDIITANQVLEHVPDPVETLSLMRDLLASGGFIWISVPNAGCIWAKELGWKWDGADLPFHLLHFDAKSLALAGAKAHLKLKRCYTVSEPWIVKFSKQKVWQEKFKIPHRLSKRLISESWAENKAKELDARNGGDKLIAEFEIA